VEPAASRPGTTLQQVATEIVDQQGLTTLKAWIDAL
jgi:hypothetical protein